jgi:hypothetical protein
MATDAEVLRKEGAKCEMNGIAWVVETFSWLNPNPTWSPSSVRATRASARQGARNLRVGGVRTRVRKYIRQPEVRP